ncbi:acyloxyacyl hydrolase [Pseudothauera nasutitermitis]|nr:acyloxyacyl hydrolase [Pseudothauera nasutitermitis]
MLSRKTSAFLAALLCAAVIALPSPTATAQTPPDSGRRFYADLGSTLEGDAAHTAAVGVLLPSSLFTGVPRDAGPLSLHWDLSLTHWRAPGAQGGHRSFTQLAAMGVWRHPLGGPGAPLFVDLGLGVSIFDRLYASGTDRFSTAFQFTQAIGLGYRFGEKHAHEISVRFQHVSNGGIKRPNPGENFVRLRFASRF